MRKEWNLWDEEQLLALTQDGLLVALCDMEVDAAAKLLLLLWRTWQVRNNIAHEKEKLSFVGSKRFLLKFWSELCKIRQQDKDHI
ncbi:hypothetical protein BS78_02G262200 [Paspalum vaginatum]|nr:hypothetical protein BS78_02G262200 [Paspalum vaginatum]